VMATTDEIKAKIAAECESLASCFPYEADQVRGESWAEIADEATLLARLVASSANVLAGYAGYSRREANRE
jgi:hypothetical protein